MEKKTLNQYYNKTNHSEIFQIAMGIVFHQYLFKITHNLTVLHPHHKLQYFEKVGWEDNWIKAAQDIVQAEALCSINLCTHVSCHIL